MLVVLYDVQVLYFTFALSYSLSGTIEYHLKFRNTIHKFLTRGFIKGL